MLLLLLPLLPAAPLLATPSQSDVFRSIQENVDESQGSGGQILPWLSAGAGVILLLAIFSRRQTRQAAAKPLNNRGRLLKELLRILPLKPREVKQLKILAEETLLEEDRPLCSPLVLVLCPSILAKALKEKTTKADAQVLREVKSKLTYQ